MFLNLTFMICMLIEAKVTISYLVSYSMEADWKYVNGL